MDGVFALGVSAETLLRYGLRKGDEIAPALLEEIGKTEEMVNARSVALHFLGIRPRTVREVRDKLREKEFGDEEIDATIASLQKSGLLDDAEFARMYVRDQLLLRPSGPILLMRKLLLLGVSKEVASSAIKDSAGTADMEARALTIARDFVRKSRSSRKNEPAIKLRQRTTSFLGRRGFSWDIIQSVIHTLADESAFSGSSGESDAEF